MQDSTSAVSTASRPRRLSFDTATIWALLLSGAVATLAFIPAAIIPFLYTKVSILAIGGLVALVLYILARLTRGNVVVPPLPLIGALWLVPAAYGLSALFGGAGFSRSFFGIEMEPNTFGFVLLLSALGTLCAVAFRRTTQYKTFFKVSAIVLAIVLAAEVVILVVSHVAPKVVSSTTNFVGSFSDLGMLAGLGIVLALLAVRFLSLAKRPRLLILGFGALALVILALVNSSLIWALVALTSLGLFIESIMRRKPTMDEDDLDGVSIAVPETGTAAAGENRPLVAPLVTLAVALFFLIGGSTIGSALVAAAGVNVVDVRPSWQSTFDIGSHTYAASPIFGSGPGTFGEQWLKFRDRSLNDTVFWSLEFTSGIGYIPTGVITTGIIGALAWLAFLALFLFFGLRALLFRMPQESFVRYTAVASFTGALYVLALSIFAVPGPIVLVLGFMLIGIFISSLRYGGSRHEWGIIFARSPRIGFIIVFGLTLLLLASIVAAYVVVERYLADVAYAQGVTALQAGDVAAATADVNRSVLFAPSDRAYQLAATIGIAHLNQIANNKALAATDAQQQFQAALSSSIEAALTATRLGPNNYQNWAILGNVYETVVPLNIDGAYQNAKTAYTHAVQLNPSNPTLPYVLAQLEIAQKNNAAAETDLIQAINLKHDYTQAIFLLSQLEVQQGKAKEALQAAEAAAYFAPSDPNVLFQVGILRSANGDTNGAIAALQQSVKTNPQYANAHFFLGVMYAIKGSFDLAIGELNAVGAMSPDNAKAVAADVAALQAGKNPFPPSRLGALGIPQAPVTEPASSTTKPTTGTTR